MQKHVVKLLLSVTKTVLWLFVSFTGRLLASKWLMCRDLDLGISKPWAWCPQRSEKRRQPFGVVVFKKKMEATAVSLKRMGCLYVVLKRKLAFDWLLVYLVSGGLAWFFVTPVMVGIIVLLYFLSAMIHIITLLDGLTSHVVMFSNFVLQIATSLCNFKLTP